MIKIIVIIKVIKMSCQKLVESRLLVRDYKFFIMRMLFYTNPLPFFMKI